MGDLRLLAADNVKLLQRGIELIARIDDGRYERDPGGDGRDGVGRQFRHLIDFYRCCLDGLPSRSVDYTRRARDARVETERDAGVAAMQRTIERLQSLGHEDVDLRVRVDRRGDDSDAPRWSRSSLGRELQFLMSHTIHHYALIRWILRLQDFEVEPEFGVAPSTLEHWRASPLPEGAPD